MRTGTTIFATILGATLLWGLGLTQTSWAQLRRDQVEMLEKAGEVMAERKQMFQTGQELFGVDKRWKQAMGGEGALGGTLLGKVPQTFRVGDWGCTSFSFRVTQKVANDTMLAVAGYSPTNDLVVLIRGLDCSKVVNGVKFILQRPVVISGTQSYATVTGASNTVLVLECDENQLMTGPHMWIAADGSDLFLAKFVEFKKGKLTLEKNGGEVVTVSIGKLSQMDRKFVREATKHRSGKKVTAPARSGSVVQKSAISKPTVAVTTNAPTSDTQPTLTQAPAQVSPTAQPMPPATKQAQPMPPAAQPSDPRRTRYLNATYGATISLVSDGKWQAANNRSGKPDSRYDEVSRTKDYVEVLQLNGNIPTRLYADHIEQKLNGRWQSVAGGHWLTR